jgi:hypothetical protein
MKRFYLRVDLPEGVYEDSVSYWFNSEDINCTWYSELGYEDIIGFDTQADVENAQTVLDAHLVEYESVTDPFGYDEDLDDDDDADDDYGDEDHNDYY